MAGPGARKIASVERSDTVENPEGIFRTTLSYNAQSMLCHFVMTKDARIPLHNHQAVQNGYVISGRLRFLREDGSSFVADSGMSYVFDAMEKHGAQVLEDAEVIECFAPMRPEYAEPPEDEEGQQGQ